MIPKQISKYVDNLQENPLDMSMADIDELMMLIEAYKAEIPIRFQEVAAQLASDYNLDFPENQIENIERLVRIIDVQSRLPNKATSSILDDELVPTFELGSKDKERVMLLCSQMRKIIFSTDVFDQPHKRRLLNRIAGIEKQVEQPKGMLDVIRGGVSDIGETLGKFGVDIKPLTDRISEVLQITRANSKEYEQLPAPEEVKQIEDKSGDE